MSITQEQFDTLMEPAGLEVYQTAQENFAGVQNTWYSPSTVDYTGDLTAGFEYSGGSVVYTGSRDIKVLMTSTVSIAQASVSVTVEFGLGKNGSVDTKSVQTTQSKAAGSPKEVSCQKVFDITNGDYLDFWVRQTSSASDDQISILNGVWTVTKVMVV